MTGEQEQYIRAYLSYRRNEVDNSERDALTQAFKNNGIELLYDEAEAVEGDDFADFMNHDVIGARFFVACLSPEYFTTAYTLHEFIEVSKSDMALPRISFVPVRMTESMVEKYITQIRASILDDDSVEMQAEIELLAKYQGIEWSTDEEQAIRAQICSAVEAGWEDLVAPNLRIIHQSFENIESTVEALGQYYDDVANRVVQQYEIELQQLEQEAQTKIRQNLIVHIDSSPELKRQLRHELGVSEQNDDKESGGIAKKLLEHDTATEAVRVIVRALEELGQGGVAFDSEEGSSALAAAKRICGWLVLRSINPVWWVHNHHNMGTQLKSRVELEENTRAYAEVIISRSVLESAQFTLDSGHKISLERNLIDLLVFDPSPEAIKQEVLKQAYKDAFRLNASPSELEPFEEDFILAVQENFMRTRKPAYYLITGDAIDLIMHENWFQSVIKKLKGIFTFVIIDIQDNSCDQNHCGEDIARLLEVVAQVYRFER